MNVETGLLKPGEARCPAESTQDIIARDQGQAPAWAASESYEYLGSEDISKDRYTEAELRQGRVREAVDPHLAVRLPRGPHPRSRRLLRLRPRPLQLRRGRAAPRTRSRPISTPACTAAPSSSRRAREGFAGNIKCPFHGWTWNLDGSLKEVPEKWDFPHFTSGKTCLPAGARRAARRVRVDQHGPRRAELEDYLGEEALAHLKAWKLEDRYIYLHVQKSYPANWKLTMEAFMEAYHVGDTHPQVAPANGDVNSQYDIYGEHVDRFISTLGVVSPKLYGKYSEQDIVDNFTLGDSSAMGGSKPQLKDGERARQVMADMFRNMFEQATNTDLSGVSDTELLDTYSYTFFPNLFLFPGISLPMVYRFRPDARDHRRTIYEVMFMRPKPLTGEVPETAERRDPRGSPVLRRGEGHGPGFRPHPRPGHRQSLRAAGRPRGQRQARHHARRLPGNPRPPFREGGRQVHGDGTQAAELARAAVVVAGTVA